MIVSSEMRDRLSVERRQPFLDAYGEDVGGWSELVSRRCKTVRGSGREAREAAQTQASTAATFYIRRDQVTQTITPADRLQVFGAVWNITAAELSGEKDDDVRITAVRAA